MMRIVKHDTNLFCKYQTASNLTDNSQHFLILLDQILLLNVIIIMRIAQNGPNVFYRHQVTQNLIYNCHDSLHFLVHDITIGIMRAT